MSKSKVLIVDDEIFNLDILESDLEDAGYETIRAEDGLIALQKLEENPDIQIIVLDRMMPNMNGIEVLHKLKSTPKWRDIPVIMQTAAAHSHQVLEGIQAGAYYYLAKPYNEETMISIVNAAIRDRKNYVGMREEVGKHKKVLGLIEKANFKFRTIEEAKDVAFYVASCCPNSENVVLGLSELAINAVEHGNLGISYKEKTELVNSGKWIEEIENRLKSANYGQKYARLSYNAMPDMLEIHIIDEGAGFDWSKYLEFTPDRATDPHGRGIAMSKMLSFDDMQYQGKGNEVICRIMLNKGANYNASSNSNDLSSSSQQSANDQ